MGAHLSLEATFHWDFDFEGSFSLVVPKDRRGGLVREGSWGKRSILRAQGQLVASSDSLSAPPCLCIVPWALWARPPEHTTGKGRGIEPQTLASPGVPVPKLWDSGLLLPRHLMFKGRSRQGWALGLPAGTDTWPIARTHAPLQGRWRSEDSAAPPPPRGSGAGSASSPTHICLQSVICCLPPPTSSFEVFSLSH